LKRFEIIICRWSAVYWMRDQMSVNSLNETPLAIAMSNNNLDLAKILLEYDANPDLVDWTNFPIDPELKDYIDYYGNFSVKNAFD
jgi:ankyrin repeat protein